MPWYLNIAIKLSEAIMILAYVVLALLLIYKFQPETILDDIVFAVLYGIFMIVSLTYILNKLPPSISKYFKNKA